MKGMRSISPLGVRIPDEVKEKIQERAKANGRSMNAEIVQILEDSVNGSGDSNDVKHLKDVMTEMRVILHLKDELLFQKDRTINALLQQVEFFEKLLKDSFGIEFGKNKNSSESKPGEPSSNSNDDKK